MKHEAKLTISNLIEEIYLSSIHKNNRSQVLKRLADITSADIALLRIRNKNNTKCTTIYAHNINPQLLKMYNSVYYKEDLFGEIVCHSQEGDTFSDSHHHPITSIKKETYYKEFLSTLDVKHIAFGIAAKTDSNIFYIEIYRKTKEHPFDNGTLSILKNILPHLRNTIMIINKLEELSYKFSLTRTFLDKIPVGIVILKSNLSVLLKNQAAEEIFNEGHTIFIKGDTLTGSTPNSNSTLTSLLRKAARGELYQPKALTLKQDCESFIRLLVTPIKRQFMDLPAECGQASAVVFIDKQSKDNALSPQTLSLLYGLTPQEARLTISLAQGFSLQDYCNIRGVTKNTARSYLKSIFSKTGTRRQSELVKVVLTGPGGFTLNTQANSRTDVTPRTLP